MSRVTVADRLVPVLDGFTGVGVALDADAFNQAHAVGAGL
jgi:hypothetical protein